MVGVERELWVVLRLLAAALLSGAIGMEREQRGKQAGLRTHMLVAVGAALVVSLAELAAADAPGIIPASPPSPMRYQVEPTQLIQAVITGVGFLGAGTIFVSGRSQRVHGLTTAASIWVTAAVGMTVGLGHYVLAVGATLLVLGVLRAARALERPGAPAQPSPPPDDGE